jgi:hypothetical protein
MDSLKRQTDSISWGTNGANTGAAANDNNSFGLNPAMNVRRAPSAEVEDKPIQPYSSS